MTLADMSLAEMLAGPVNAHACRTGILTVEDIAITLAETVCGPEPEESRGVWSLTVAFLSFTIEARLEELRHSS